MTVKVELGFTADGVGAPFFTLDNPTLGVLDAPGVYLGGGEAFVDVTSYFQGYAIQRGKSRELDRYQAGQTSVTFDNTQRVFDPNFEASPYFGQIVPKRNVRITYGTEIQFLGIIEDWNISYDAGGQSLATLQAFDSFSFLTNYNFDGQLYPAQETETRVNSILDDIGWSATARDIADTGAQLESVQYETEPVLGELQKTAQSEPGDLFLAKNGDIKLVGRNSAFTSTGLVLSDDGTAVNYQAISAIYGSELLYNNSVVTSGTGTATASDATSIQIYGQRDLEQATYLDSDFQLQLLADYLVTRYADPEFRFEAVSVNLDDVTDAQRIDIMNTELAEVVKVVFTPSGIPPAVVQYGKVIGITQEINTNSERVTFKLQSTSGSLFVLGDAVFGRLTADNLLGW
jgi:hypothetical protein